MAELEKISTTHDQIMNWLILNPGVNQRVCADYFGYSQSWLSSMINSDTFQAKLKERQDEVFGEVALSIPEKLKVLGDIVTSQLAEQLEKNRDKQYTLDAFDKIMHRSGYAPASAKTAPQTLNQQNNFYGVDKDVLAAARATMQASVTVEAIATEEVSFEAIESLVK